jgi:hypothetical protein
MVTRLLLEKLFSVSTWLSRGTMECGDLSPLWLAATCSSLPKLNGFQQASGVKPPEAKAVTGYRTPKV